MDRAKTKAVGFKTQAEMLEDFTWNDEEIDDLYGSRGQVAAAKLNRLASEASGECV